MRTIIDTQKKLIHDQEERIKNLLKETKRPTADLSELLYGNRKRSVSNLLGEKSNPTAHTLEH